MAPNPSADYEHLYEDPAIYARRWFLLAMMCTSLVLVVMSVSGMNVALPSLQRDLQAKSTDLQWIVDAYSLVFAGLLLTAGAIGDRYGRRRALVGGLIVFAGGAAVGGFAKSAHVVTAGRSIMGIGAAFVMPATLSLVTNIFPPRERRRAIAIWAGFAGAGGAIGPLVSGALLNHFWWGAALLINVPVVAVILVCILTFAPTSRDPESTPLDPIGAVLSLVGLSALVYGIIEGPNKGWMTSGELTAFGIAVVTLGAFLAWERRSPHPMLPLPLFRDRRFSVGASVISLTFFVMFGFFFLITQYLQFVRGYSPFLAGAATLPFAAALVVVSPRSAALAERLGTGRVVSIGFLLVASGFVVLTVISPNSPYAVLALSFILLGCGMGITVAPSTGNIMSAVPQAKAGVGSAVNDTTRELGGALGIAVLGSIVNAGYRGAVHLGDLRLPPPAHAAAAESVGAASEVAGRLPGGGVELLHRSGQAFTDAFNHSSLVSAIWCVLASILIGFVFNRRAENRAEADAVAAGAPATRAEPLVSPTRRP